MSGLAALHQLTEHQLLALIHKSADKRALTEIERRACLGRPPLFGLLGKLYAQGYGALDRDCDKAIRYFSMGMTRGDNILTPLALANAYCFGECVERDYVKAFQLIRQVAVNERDWIAASRLSLMLEKGYGCEPDIKEAADWMSVAWRRGSLVALPQYGRLLVHCGQPIKGNLIRLFAALFIFPLILIKGYSHRRCKVW